MTEYPLEFPQRRLYARLSRVDALSVGPAARASFEFDCIDADFADGVEGAIDKAFDKGVTKPFAVIRIVTTPRRFEDVAGAPGVPGSWFALEIGPKGSAPSLLTWHAQFQPNGFPSHSRGATNGITYLGSDEPSAPRSPRPQSLGAAVAKQTTVASAVIAACAMPAASSGQSIGGALAPIAGVASLRVRDVGQASFSSLCDASGKAVMHYDVGFPISFNGHTSPKTFDLDVTETPPVVLSHWDWDHLHAAFLHPHLMDCMWIVPDQKLGPGAARLAHILAAKGNLLIHPAASPTSLAWGEIAQAAGPLGSANDAGLTASVTLSSGDTILLTGDADYAFLSHAALPPVDYLVATHHGARFASGSAAIPPPKPKGAGLLLSYGKRNVYRHPHADALRQHRIAGWTKQVTTAQTSAAPRGDRTVP